MKSPVYSAFGEWDWTFGDLKVLGKALCFSFLIGMLGGVIIVVALTLANHHWEQPKLGDSVMVLREKFGEPGRIETKSSKAPIWEPRWLSVEGGDWIEKSDLPRLNEQRWFYTNGLLGTVHYLVYVEKGRVTHIYWCAT